MNFDKEAKKILTQVYKLGYRSEAYMSESIGKIYAKGEEAGFTKGLKTAIKIQTFMRKVCNNENIHHT